MTITFKTLQALLTTLFVAWSLLACGGGSSSPSTTAPGAQPQSLQQVADQAVASGVTGIMILVEQRGNLQIVTAGVADKISQQPMTGDELFKIASISKLFLAVTAVKASQLQLLSLDDNLASWLPELAERIENSSDITVRQLIQHRSGVPDFDSQTGFSWQSAHTDIEQTLAFALDKPADFLPDQTYQYSNTNYLLLAKILDQALGYPHGEFIDNQILAPLTLNRTFLDQQLTAPELISRGYWQDRDRRSQHYLIPGGSMIASITDTASFIRGLNTGDLLTPSERNVYSQVYWFNHSGWLPGYQSIARYHRGIDAVLLQFVNHTGDNSETIATESYQAALDFLSAPD